MRLCFLHFVYFVFFCFVFCFLFFYSVIWAGVGALLIVGAFSRMSMRMRQCFLSVSIVHFLHLSLRLFSCFLFFSLCIYFNCLYVVVLFFGGGFLHCQSYLRLSFLSISPFDSFHSVCFDQVLFSFIYSSLCISALC